MQVSLECIFYVFDTSIAQEVIVWQQLFDEIIQKGGYLILTSVVLEELIKMKQHQPQDELAIGADAILKRAASDEKHFLVERIGENHTLPDDNIIAYCIGKRNHVLVTADKVMALKARMDNVKTKYIKRFIPQDSSVKEKIPIQLHSQPSQEKTIEKIAEKLLTIPCIKYHDGQILIEEFKRKEEFIRVFSKGRFYTWGPLELMRGDEVYLISPVNNSDSFLFQHFRVIRIAAVDNVKSLFQRKLTEKEVHQLPAKYQKFLTDYFTWRRKSA